MGNGTLVYGVLITDLEFLKLCYKYCKNSTLKEFAELSDLNFC